MFGTLQSIKISLLTCCHYSIASHALIPAVSTCLTLKEIKNELTEVTEWYQLGVELGLGAPQLREIERDHPQDTQRCKTEVLDWWLRNAPEVSWEKLAQALETMGGHATVTQKLRKKVPKG